MSTSEHEVAIIGMAGRFPGAKDIDAFWKNLQSGVESISFFSDGELLAANIEPALLNNPNYVRAQGVLEGVDLFDASFFGYNPREAELIDPQQRLFLECAWEALENAGYDAERYHGLIGVYAGSSLNTYLLTNLFSNPKLRESMDWLPIQFSNDKDFLCTRVSYKLNLTGPSVTIQTACSTSLVAVHLAYLSLLNGECDIALAGGVSVRSTQVGGYLYQEGSILSPDGHCRAFDAKAQGTVDGNGVGVVVLKRLEDAMIDGDHIYAIIKGSAINNDGSHKAGYTAPSVDGQAKAIREAQAMAEVEAGSISYVEAHGTATLLGDPIEVAALTEAFQANTSNRGFCAIGSVKTNLGHLDTAAGIAGLIKTTLALQHKSLPPSLHFEQPNPAIDLANSPFYVNTTLAEWNAKGTPLRAGVSSFGIGGTNAHLILEEAPLTEHAHARKSGNDRAFQLLLLSAKTETALEKMTSNLADYLRAHTHVDLSDVAYTTQVGRKVFNYRRSIVCGDCEDAIAVLETLDPQCVFTAYQEPVGRSLVFMFPGGGSQYIGMGSKLYKTEATFRENVDLCSKILKPHLNLDLRTVLYPEEHDISQASARLQQASIALTSLFVVEYTLAKQWMAWGIHPQAMIGHSLGEYVAACLAGVLSLEDALALVVFRGKLFEQLPSGAMLSVLLTEDEVKPLLGKHISIAAINGPSQCVISGSLSDIEEMEVLFSKKGITFQRLLADVALAAHSKMVTPILEPFRKFLEKVDLRPPTIPYISGVTGRWISAAEATDVDYWAKHLRQTVLFKDGIQELMKKPDRILLEVGPGQVLSKLAKLQVASEYKQSIISSMGHPHDQQSDLAVLLRALGKLWLAGLTIDWSKFRSFEKRLPIPTYPFERQRYWIEQWEATSSEENHRIHQKNPMTEWFYIPTWRHSMSPKPFKANELKKQKKLWILLANEAPFDFLLTKHLKEEGQVVMTVRRGQGFSKVSDDTYVIDPNIPKDYIALIRDIQIPNDIPCEIIHLWSITYKDQGEAREIVFNDIQEKGFYSLLFLAQALGAENVTHRLQIWVVTNYSQAIESRDRTYPEKATMLGPCKVIPQEYRNITCRYIDMDIADLEPTARFKVANQLLAELNASSSDMIIGYRNHQRWVQTFEQVRLDDNTVKSLRKNGVYIIIGGMGTVGFLLAEFLAKAVQARLVLVGTSTFPRKEDWKEWLDTHDQKDSTSQKIRAMQNLEGTGAKISFSMADIANESEMDLVIKQATERYGEIHGIIHAAITRENISRFIPDTTPTHCEEYFRAKVYGLFVLEKVLRGRSLDFCVLVSSNASVLGGLGQIAYSAVNNFMDAFAISRHRSGDLYWVSTNWDRWLSHNENNASIGTTSIDQYAITPSESADIFGRILSASTSAQVVVSTGDLKFRINQWIKFEAFPKKENSRNSDPFTSLYSRPDLRGSYVAPRNQIEQTIAEIWKQLLGIEKIGVYDNFFELGGHSLLVVQLNARLRNNFQVELPVRRLFEAPTIADAALIVVQSQAQQIDSELLDTIIKTLEQLPESEEEE